MLDGRCCVVQKSRSVRLVMPMSDVFSKKKRSEIMSRVKGHGNAATEIALLRILREHRIAGWRRHPAIFGKPDFVFPKARLAVFVDGCFWHGCPRHRSRPVENRQFWDKKLARNRARDRLVNRTLRDNGWRILRVWQHELRDQVRVARRVSKALSHSRDERAPHPKRKHKRKHTLRKFAQTNRANRE
jgi:DNA mismatch endonuclease (patch repair protein)